MLDLATHPPCCKCGSNMYVYRILILTVFFFSCGGSLKKRPLVAIILAVFWGLILKK